MRGHAVCVRSMRGEGECRVGDAPRCRCRSNLRYETPGEVEGGRTEKCRRGAYRRGEDAS